MLSRSQKIRLGVFLLVGFVLTGGAITLIAGLSLFRTTDSYRIRFRLSVSGLSPGSGVTLKGVKVGRVESIQIDKKTFDVVDVRISVTKGTPIPKDSRAILASHGITGIKFIEIKSGKSRTLLKPGSEITPGESTIQRLSGKADIIALKIEKLLNNLLDLTKGKNRGHFVDVLKRGKAFLGSGDLALQAIAILIRDLRPALKRSLRNFERAAYRLRRSMRHLDEVFVETGRQLRATLVTARGALEDARGFLGKRGKMSMTLTQIQKSVRNVEKRLLANDVTESVGAARKSLIALRLLLSDLRTVVGQAKGNVKPITNSLRNAAEHLEEFARTIRENPAAILRPGSIKRRKLPK